MTRDPKEMIQECCTILDPLLKQQGFQLASVDSGQGSGGPYARAEYQNADRRLEFHYRFSLGLVTYHFGSETISHESYMRAVLGQVGGNKYPGFSDDPREPFLDLKYDLEHYASAFLTGDKQEFEKSLKLAREFESRPGIAKVP